jgi:isoleucyl-tRNA synthetase
LPIAEFVDFRFGGMEMAKYYREPAGETFPQLEEEILQFWQENDIPLKVRERMREGAPLVFCEGPPTVNNRPNIGHALTRSVKDSFLRYNAMNGRKVTPYLAGWDCHGLPVEIEIEKSLQLKTKRDIESFGVEAFNSLCRERVLTFKSEWERMSHRIGYWLDYDNAYLTMSNDYVDSVWWAVKELHSRGLLSKSRRVVPYCYRCGTTLSNHEVALGFREREDRYVVARFRIPSINATALSRTSSPWTLVANTYLAVRRDWDYVVVDYNRERLLMAERHVKEVLPEGSVLERVKGASLIGADYEPLFDFIPRSEGVFRVVHSDAVPEDDGTGVVQISPAYAMDDFGIAMAEGAEIFDPVDDLGRFTDEIPGLEGKTARDSDVEIIRLLEVSGRLFRWGMIRHSYPLCWRCETPLIYKPRDSWAVSASGARKRMQELNDSIRWVPETFKEGRFGNFLTEAKDWVISRTRYWGTPLPIWRCGSGHELCVGSMEELRLHAPDQVPKDMDPHRPHVDNVSVKCPECGSSMTREEHVLDCWFDSACAPFAQYHYPVENMEQFDSHRSVDFITEAVDQTRGWFYTTHALSTLLFDLPAFNSVLVMGHVLDERGRKMHVDTGNVVYPEEMFESVGADASRLYLLGTPVWQDVEFSMESVRLTMVRNLTTLVNVFSFFATNANRVNYRGETLKRKTHDLDRWILSRLNSTIMESRDAFDSLEVHRAVRAFVEFVDDLSNWYLRRSRRRFQQEGDPQDRFSAYSTLHECLMAVSKLMAPVTPFLAEGLYKSMNGPLESVHLESYPVQMQKATNEALESQMALVRRAVESGRLARQKADIKMRQPLDEAVIAAGKDGVWVLRRYEKMIAEELNVKKIECIESREPMIEYVVSPNMRSMGPRLKESASEVAKLLEKVDGNEVVRHLSSAGRIRLGGFDIQEEDVVITEREKPGYSHAGVGDVHVYMSTSIRTKLKLEGLAREVTRRIQHMRKETGLEFGQKIVVEYNAHPDIEHAISSYEETITREIGATSLVKKPSVEGGKKWTVNKMPLEVSIRKA